VIEPSWPSPAELCAAVAGRLEEVLQATPDVMREVFRSIMSSEDRVLSATPRPQSSLLVAAAAVSAGGTWQTALWPAVAVECVMAAADVFDDIADSEATELDTRFGPGVALMGAAGLLTLGIGVIGRAVNDGLPHATVLEAVQLLTSELIAAADGQARSLRRETVIDATDAYDLAAAKSGPLGSLAACLGARTVSDDPELLRLYGRYGWHLAVYSQLFNDARDAAPSGSRRKRDVREGRNTVPLVFTHSSGAPPQLGGTALQEWERLERERVEAEGGVLTAVALAQAERVHALEVLETLARIGRPVQLLRQLLDPRA
jgi:geranylgeranyl pyrophosphate synthase